jgi:hypothetical protein
MLLFFVALIFFYVGSRFVHSLRYLLPIVPFLCLSAAYGVASLERYSTALQQFVKVAVLTLTALYAAAFVQIYTRPNTRIAASEWIYQNVPAGSRLLNEEWDDPLPVPLHPTPYGGSMYPVFNADDQDKLKKLYTGLAHTDYYILSSPRVWNTIGRLPDRYPFMHRFYKLLFDGKLGFEEVAHFTSYPKILGFTIHDLSAEETFWVYDHPPVIIFRKTQSLTREQFESLFSDLKGKEVPDPAHPPGSQ